MKRSKILSLFALLLSALMLFSACSLGKTKVDQKKILDSGAKPDADIVYNDGKEVSELKGATLDGYASGNLATFTKPVRDKADQTEYLEIGRAHV